MLQKVYGLPSISNY